MLFKLLSTKQNVSVRNLKKLRTVVLVILILIIVIKNFNTANNLKTNKRVLLTNEIEILHFTITSPTVDFTVIK